MKLINPNFKEKKFADFNGVLVNSVLDKNSKIYGKRIIQRHTIAKPLQIVQFITIANL